tara:strand:- start:1106 stop:1501 length:396 start_codon:yes stop_codon:yes gene_type:complete
MPRQRKKKVMIGESIQRYAQRVSALPLSKYEELRGAYLSTFEVYSTATSVAEGSALDCFAATLMRVAREKGIGVLGITSERKTRGEYIVSEIDGKPRSEVCCVYVGKYNYFSGNAKSYFAPVSKDYVYEES